MKRFLLTLSVLAGVVVAAKAADSEPAPKRVELLNVSYDPTRELWQDLNKHFSARYQHDTGVQVAIQQSHGGSTRQAEAVLAGQEADVVTLALWSDTDRLRKKGLIAEGWERRLPHRSLPYTSTIVFVIRKGNPQGIHDWADLVKPGVHIVTPDPRTSGNGKLSFLAAWGSVLQRGGSEAEALAFVSKLYRQVQALDAGARQSSQSFVQKGIGDVHLTWENEAQREVAAADGKLELVYPPISIQAEPHVALVDANVNRHGTRAVAEAYLKYLYTDEAQEILARHHYRPIKPAVLRKHAEQFPEIELFTIQALARDWQDAQDRFFAAGGIFEKIRPGADRR